MDIKNTTKSFTGLFEGNKKLKRFLPQFITVVLIAFVFGFFAYNASVNMDNRGIDFGLRFLGEESSFDIQFTLIEYSGASSYAKAYLVGLLNTILVAAIGIFFATIIGVVVGISRLSSNYLIYKVSEWYIEIFRNIPLLLQLFFWYFAVLRLLPLPQDAEILLGVSYLTIKGWYVPAFIWNNLNVFLYSVIAVIIKEYF